MKFKKIQQAGHCALKSSIPKAISKNLFREEGSLYKFLKVAEGVEPVIQVGELTNASDFRLQPYHKAEITRHLRESISGKTLYQYLTPRLSHKLLELFITLDDQYNFHQIDDLTTNIKETLSQFSKEQLEGIRDLYAILADKKLYELREPLDKNFQNSLGLTRYLQNLGLDSLHKDGVGASCDLNGRIKLKDSKEGFTLDVIFYDDNNIDHINVVKARLFKDRASYWKYFVDLPPITFKGRTLNFIDGDTTELYGEYIDHQGYRFEDREFLLMYRPTGKRPCALNTFLAFLNLKSSLKVELSGKGIESCFEPTLERLSEKTFSAFMDNYKLLASITLANFMASEDFVCKGFTKVTKKRPLACAETLGACSNPLRSLVETEAYRALFAERVESTAANIIESIRATIAGSSFGQEQQSLKSQNPSFCAFLNIRDKNLYMKYLLENIRSRTRVDKGHKGRRPPLESTAAALMKHEYLTLGNTSIADSVAIDEEIAKMLQFDQVFEGPGINGNPSCSLMNVVFNKTHSS